jgi:hypothetical protein
VTYGAVGFDPGDVDIAVEDCLAGGELGFGLGAVAVPLRLLDGCLGVDLGYLPVLLTLALGFAYVTAELGVGYVDTGLLMCWLTMSVRYNGSRGKLYE